MRGQALQAVFITVVCVGSLSFAADPVDGVLTAFHHYDDGWRRDSVAEILSTMAPDVEWTNSVGLRFTGKRALEPFLTHLFKNSNFLAGKPGPTIIKLVRVFGNTAVVSSRQTTLEQKDYKTGKTVPKQYTNEMTVFEMRGGQWLIVMDLTSDEANGI
jgi:ketosteroid isomerase-like protein